MELEIILYIKASGSVLVYNTSEEPHREIIYDDEQGVFPTIIQEVSHYTDAEIAQEDYLAGDKDDFHPFVVINCKE